MIWIECAMREPAHDGAYITWDGKSATVTAFIFGQWQANNFAKKSISHWMPLPKGPEV